MNLLLAITIGTLVFAGVYQLLGREVFRVPFGVYLLLTAVNLLVLAMRSVPGVAPFAHLAGPRTDPLAQAMVLTAIIIGFAISTLVLLATGRLARHKRAQRVDEVREWKE